MRVQGPDRQQRRAPSGGAQAKGPAYGRATGLVRAGLILGLWLFIGLVVFLAWAARDLPNPDRLKAANPHPSVMVLAANGDTLAVQGDAYGQTLDFDDLPPDLIHALIATEDRRFFQHPGFDIVGLARSALHDLIHGH